jgi:hypothetical protein
MMQKTVHVRTASQVRIPCRRSIAVLQTRWQSLANIVRARLPKVQSLRVEKAQPSQSVHSIANVVQVAAVAANALLNCSTTFSKSRP